MPRIGRGKRSLTGSIVAVMIFVLDPECFIPDPVMDPIFEAV
jgi:hypothetical protein